MPAQSAVRPASIAAALLAAACAATSPGPQAAEPLTLVDSVDLERYQGLWYEIARLPNDFQDQCRGDVTAEYTLREDGGIRVVNRCRTADDEFDEAEGVARRPDPDRPGALEVRFAPGWLSWLPAVWGDYQILALDDEYRWVLVGAPSREYLWILAREPDMRKDRFQSLLDRAASQGFPVEDLRRTEHGAP